MNVKIITLCEYDYLYYRKYKLEGDAVMICETMPCLGAYCGLTLSANAKQRCA